MNYKQKADALLKKWMLENNLEGDYVIHHRNDTEECRQYNKMHYKMWGFNLDGTFEYGKYVVYMTRSEHSSYHNKGTDNPFYGHQHTLEQRSKWSNQRKGRTLSVEWKENISKGSVHISGMKGKHHTEEIKQQISISVSKVLKGVPKSDAHRRRLSEAKKGIPKSEDFKQQLKTTLNALKFLYNIYRNSGGILKWNDFRRSIKNGDITFNNDTTISIFIDK